MRKAAVIVILLALAGGAWWWYHRESADQQELVLYGNVDLRQIELPFNNNERVVEVLAQEGDRVTQGQVLARLDTRRLEPQVDQAAAQVAAQQQVVERMHNGSRPEEVAQARANVESARANAANAQRQFERLTNLVSGSAGRAVSQQEVDNAKAALDVAEATLHVNEQALELAVLGPRKEDVAEAEARLKIQEAGLEFLRQQLADAQLLAPVDAVVRTRVMEPGEIASPQRPVYVLAVTDPKWVRAYVSESDLGKIRPGMKAQIQVDSFPDRRLEGWIGFISPVAEFTPKSVETKQLRTSLVYEVRVFVKDPQDELRLGMPATVLIDRDSSPADRSDAPVVPSLPEPATRPPVEKDRT